MKRIVFASALALAATAANASTEWTLTKANKVYSVDTLYHATIGPGTTLTELQLKGEYLLHLWYTTSDLRHENLEIRTVKAGDDRLTRQTVPVIAQKHDIEGEVTHFAGINSDFFNMEAPYYYTNGNAIHNGNFISPQNAETWQHFMILKDKTPLIAETVSYAPYATFPNGGGTWYYKTWGTRGSGEMCIYAYDKDKGGTQTTGQNKWGSECVIKPKLSAHAATTFDQEWEVVSTPTVPNTTLGIEIPAGQAVLSGNGKAATLISGLKPGDTFTTRYTFKADGVEVVPMQMSGGMNILLKDGVQIDISSSNAPRSLVGYSEDKNKVILMAIDGRRDGWSAGAYYRLCAAIMQQVGCHDALEFDGGGSTTFYAKSLGGTLNKPSDNSLRTVAAAAYATAVAPNDWNVTSIEVKQKNVKLEVGEKFTPVVYGYNKYGVLIDTNITGYTLEAPAGLGTVSADGKTLTGTGEGYWPLTVKYGLVSTVIPVKMPGEAGVDGVEADETDLPARYYNLNGVEVQEPTAGLYIMRRGSKATKVVIK